MHLGRGPVDPRYRTEVRARLSQVVHRVLHQPPVRVLGVDLHMLLHVIPAGKRPLASSERALEGLHSAVKITVTVQAIDTISHVCRA